MDINSNPSQATRNNSKIQIRGENETWVEGAYSRICKFLQQRKTGRSWFHKNYIYDLFLWFISIPIAFWNMYKIETSLHPFFSQISSVLTICFYLYIFIFIIILSRFLFAYLRWLFPYIELRRQRKRRNQIHKTFVGAIIICIIGGLMLELIINIISRII